MDTNSRLIHAASFILCLIISAVLMYGLSDLRKDQPTTLGTIGVFLTLYGVIFAIIEVVRLRNAAALAKAEAERVFKSVTNLVTAREIIECQTRIEIAVEAIDERRIIPSSSLCSIVKLYSQVFYNEVIDENSEHRRNRSTVESYYIQGKSPSVASQNTKRALLGIAGHLAQLQGSTKNFAEYKK